VVAGRAPPPPPPAGPLSPPPAGGAGEGGGEGAPGAAPPPPPPQPHNPPPGPGHTGPVMCVACHPRWPVLASAGGAGDGCVKVWVDEKGGG
jgi:Wiskott-Aldrich syndrome protein